MSGKRKEDWLYLFNRQRGVKLDAEGLRRKLRAILVANGLTFRTLGIILVSDRHISAFNRRFCGHPGPTDVISFPQGRRSGEILISVETAGRQAVERAHSLERELLVLALHGALHLSGHDDRRGEDRRRMEVETGRMLGTIGE